MSCIVITGNAGMFYQCQRVVITGNAGMFYQCQRVVITGNAGMFYQCQIHGTHSTHGSTSKLPLLESSIRSHLLLFGSKTPRPIFDFKP
jgi:hypothetical protein